MGKGEVTFDSRTQSHLSSAYKPVPQFHMQPRISKVVTSFRADFMSAPYLQQPIEESSMLDLSQEGSRTNTALRVNDTASSVNTNGIASSPKFATMEKSPTLQEMITVGTQNNTRKMIMLSDLMKQ